MALNPLIDVVRRKLYRLELIIVVRVEHPKLAAALLLHGCLVALDGVRSSCLGIEQHGPHIVGGVIDEQ